MAITVQEAAALCVVASVLRAQADELPASSSIGSQLTALANQWAEIAGPRLPDAEVEERERKRQAILEHDEAMREAEATWRALSRGARERLMFEVLGDERLLIREITERANTALGYPKDGRECAVWAAAIRSLLARLVRNGELEREPEPFEGKIRYRYSRKRELAGPIADLERSFSEPEVA